MLEESVRRKQMTQQAAQPRRFDVENNKSDAVPELQIGFFERIRRQLRERIHVLRLQNEIAPLLPNGGANELFQRLDHIGRNVKCAHNPSHALEFVLDMLRAPRS